MKTLTWPQWLVRLFALDVRALIFLRIGLGSLLLTDLAGRARDLTAHYTDAGVLPRSARIAMQWDYCEPWWMSLHMLSGSVWWQSVLFSVAAIAATCLMLGYRTKPTLFVSWLLLLSLHGRFPLLTQGGDALLRCMLFWALFLPLNGGQRSQLRCQGLAVASFGTAAFIVQLAIMYLFTAMLKTGPAWRSDFSATYYALSIDHFTSEFGYVLLGYPRLLQLLTIAAISLEWLGPLLLFMPTRHSLVRTAVPLTFIGFHLGLAAAMDLGTFPWICILMWIVLLPSNVWDRVEQVIAICGKAGFLGRARLPASRSANNAPPDQQPIQLIGSFAINCIAAFFLSYVVLLNIKRLAHPRATIGNAPLSLLGQATGLDQYWNMFSPDPYQFGGWLRIEGETATGELVNLFQPAEALPESKPPNVSASYPTQYWRRCLVTMYEFQEQSHIEGGLRFFARQWNATHESQVHVVFARLVHMVEPIPPPFRTEPTRCIERHELGCIAVAAE